MDNLAKVVDVPAYAPKSVDEQGVFAVRDRLGREPEESAARSCLEAKLLHVGTTGENPATEEQGPDDRGGPCGDAGVGQVGGKPNSNRVKVRVEGEAAESELEAHPFRNEAVRP